MINPFTTKFLLIITCPFPYSYSMYVHKVTSVATPAVDHMYEAKPQLTSFTEAKIPWSSIYNDNTD